METALGSSDGTDKEDGILLDYLEGLKLGLDEGTEIFI